MDTRGMSYRVLIVDDVPAVRESLRWLLEDERDLTVVGEAGDGVQAIQRARELAPDVVILDVELSELDGYQVAHQLKLFAHPPLIIFLSVHVDALSRERGKQSGGDGFVAKSDGWSALITQIRDGLATRGS
jgi:two-component system response regulator EvgA